MEEQNKELNIEYIRESRDLLRDILENPVCLEWCKRYSCYGNDLEMPTYKDRSLGYVITSFEENAYKYNMVPRDYAEQMQIADPENKYRRQADVEWVRALTKEQIIGCIGWHFRRDHFDNGALIHASIADGALFRLFDRLAEIFSQEQI